MTSPLVIGITECGKWDNYAKWVQRSYPHVRTLKLLWREPTSDDFDHCDGLMLTGGEDVHPRFYGVPEKVAELDPKEINERRDEFELRIIETALKKGSPILGICRGLQIVNVHFGGTLILDIPRAGKSDHSKSPGSDRTHAVNVARSTLLEKCVGVNRGEVNSSHHQAAERGGKGLRVSALADDGIIEAMEWEKPDRNPFLLLVQWHPERMQTLESPFSKNVLFEFVQAAAKKQRQGTAISSLTK